MLVWCGADWLNSRARLFSNDCAVIDAETKDTWNYEELNTRANKLANFFIESGIQPGDRIALLAPNHISYFDFLFSCMKIGAVFVPLNWRLTDDELYYLIRDASPKIVGVHSHFKDKENIVSDGIDLLRIESNHYLSNIESKEFFENKAYHPKEKSPLAMIYTGGTTGKPKGAILSNRSIFTNALNTIVSWNLSNLDCTLTSLPMFHTGGLNALSIPLLMAGGTVVLSSAFEPEKAIEDIETYECTIVLFVPTMHHMIVQSEAFKKAKFEKMKVFLSGGAPCPLTIYKAYEDKGLSFKEGYGLTEAGPNNFYIDPLDSRRKPGSVGKPMMFNEIKILNPEGGEVRVGEVGELLLRGHHTFEFYWNNEESTNEALVNGWLHTGDLVKQDDEGFVYIVGRKKDMIITGGENVYPLEIEHWLQSHEGINEVAVVGLPDEKWGEVVTAFVSLKKGVTLTIEDLGDYCGKKLTRYKIPKHFHIIDELPKTFVGKINKQALLKQYSV